MSLSKKNLDKLNKYKKKIHSIFHFGEFARIYQSFKKFDECYQSNTIGSKAVFKFCLDNKIRLIYSATSAVWEIKEKTRIFLHMLLQNLKI